MTRGLAQAPSSMAGQPQGQQGAHTKHHAYVFPLLNNNGAMDILTPSGLALLSGASASFSLVLLVLSLLTD